MDLTFVEYQFEEPAAEHAEDQPAVSHEQTGDEDSPPLARSHTADPVASHSR